MQQNKNFHITLGFLSAVLMVCGILLYSFSFGNGMFWDDDDFILHNQYIRNFSHIPEMFSGNVIAGSGLTSDYWRPVLLLVFSLEWHAWGDWPVGYHIVNALIHALDAVLILWIVAKLFRSKWLGCIVALIFLVHPLQTEAVAYVNSLGDSLSLLWMLVGIYAYQHYIERGKVWYPVISLACYALALMSKETAVIMPALLLLVDVFSRSVPMHRPTREQPMNGHATRIMSLLRVLPFFVVGLAYVGLRATTLNFKNSFNLYDASNAFTDSIFVRLFTFCKTLVTYIGLMFWPHTLHMERQAEFASRIDGGVILGALIGLSLVTLAIYAWRRAKPVTFGIFWFFIALAPTSNIAVPINGLLYEHWLYVPLIGMATAVGYFALSVYRSFDSRTVRRSLTALGLVIVLALMVRTVMRLHEWRDPITFYTQTIKFAPNSYRIQNNLGMSYADRGDLSHAIEHYNAAIAMDKTNPVALHNLANAYRSLGDKEGSLNLFLHILSLDPKFFYSYSYAINGLIEAGRYAEAADMVEQLMKYGGESEQLRATAAQLRAKAEEIKNSQFPISNTQ